MTVVYDDESEVYELYEVPDGDSAWAQRASAEERTKHMFYVGDSRPLSIEAHGLNEAPGTERHVTFYSVDGNGDSTVKMLEWFWGDQFDGIVYARRNLHVGDRLTVGGSTERVAQVQVQTSAATNVGQVTRGAVNQAVDLSQWWTSGGATLSAMTNEGEYDNRTPGRGVILTSPNGTRYRLTVGDDGTLTTTAL